MASGKQLPQTLLEAIRHFSDLDVATDFVASIRWPEGFICPACQGREFSYLKTRRLWKCKACKKQTSVKKGTIFEDSPISLDKWLAALWLLVNCKNGISSYEVGRDIGVSQKAAWFMLQRLRLALQEGSIEKYADKFDGVVEVDETYIGGKARNRHADLQDRNQGPFKGKVGVMGFLERGGSVRLTVIPTTKRHVVQKEVRRRVRPGAEVVSDDLRSYQGLDAHYTHRVVNHAETYVDGLVHTNGLENFWSLLKRGLGGTYISVQPFHLFRYLDEQAYRYNNREGCDANRFVAALSQTADRRVTWKQLNREGTSQRTRFPADTVPAQTPTRASYSSILRVEARVGQSFCLRSFFCSLTLLSIWDFGTDRTRRRASSNRSKGVCLGDSGFTGSVYVQLPSVEWFRALPPRLSPASRAPRPEVWRDIRRSFLQ